MPDYIPPLPKPYQKEGLVLSMPKKEQRAYRVEQFALQKGICACGCDRPMTLVQLLPDSATIDHIIVQPMGHKKNWAKSNLRLLRWQCNVAKGSKRPTCEIPSPSGM